MGCHFLLQSMKVKSESEDIQSYPTLTRIPQLTRLLHPWDFPGKSTGVGCHCNPESPNSLFKPPSTPCLPNLISILSPCSLYSSHTGLK